MNKFLQKNYLIISILSTVILFLSFNFIIQKINFNLGIDFTSTKTFTLSSGTKRVIDEIEEPLIINFIYSIFHYVGKSTFPSGLYTTNNIIFNIK